MPSVSLFVAIRRWQHLDDGREWQAIREGNLGQRFDGERRDVRKRRQHCLAPPQLPEEAQAPGDPEPRLLHAQSYAAAQRLAEEGAHTDAFNGGLRPLGRSP
jgi:hypothetical protein